jgi:hypothetical protein
MTLGACRQNISRSLFVLTLIKFRPECQVQEKCKELRKKKKKTIVIIVIMSSVLENPLCAGDRGWVLLDPDLFSFPQVICGDWSCFYLSFYFGGTEV